MQENKIYKSIIKFTENLRVGERRRDVFGVNKK